MDQATQNAVDAIYRGFRDSSLVGQINTDFDGCWGLQQSAALAVVSPEAHTTFLRLRSASHKRLVINTGRPPESLIYSLNRSLIQQAQNDPSCLEAVNSQFILPRAVCEMGTVFMSRSRCKVVDSEHDLNGGNARPGFEFLPCQIAELFQPLRIDADPTFNADDKKGVLTLLQRVREVLHRMDDPNFEFEPKRHTVTLHSKNGRTSADSQNKLIDVIGVLVGSNQMQVERDGKIVKLTVPHFTDNAGAGDRFESIVIKITQGHNVADALPFGLDKTSATHEIMNRSHARHGKPIFSVTVGDSPVDALITRGVMSSPHYGGKFCIRVGDTPFEPADEKNVDLVIPGDKATAVEGFVSFMRKVADKLDGNGTNRVLSLPPHRNPAPARIHERHLLLRTRGSK